MKLKCLRILILALVVHCQNNPVKFEEINDDLQGNWSANNLDSMTLRSEKTFVKNDTGFFYSDVDVNKRYYDSVWGFCTISNDTLIHCLVTGKKYVNLDTSNHAVFFGISGNMPVHFLGHDTAYFYQQLFIRKK